MSATNGPGVVMSGLVLDCDMGNLQRSYRGKPTTNHIANADTMAGFSNYSYGPTSQRITEFGTTGWFMNKAGSWNGCYKSITVPSTGVYTFSAWFKYYGGASENNGATVYISGWGSGDSAIALDKSKIGIWQRVSITLTCTNTSMTFYLISYAGTPGSSNSTWEVTMPQVESGSFATPFVNGTRSSTQALIDLTGNNVITCSSLTYASDNTFSFNGASDYLSIAKITALQLGTGAITVEHWINKPTQNTSYSALFFGGGCGGGAGYGTAIFSNSLLRYEINGPSGGRQAYNGYLTILDNTWYHIVTIFDCVSNNMRCYVNGIETHNTSITNPGNVTNNYNYFRFGAHDGSDWFYKGIAANIKVYNKALSGIEVKQNFNAIRSRFGI